MRNLKMVFVLALSLISTATLAEKSIAEKIAQARNLPADNKILFFMGQDSDSLSEYKQAVLDKDKKMPKPGGFTLYAPLMIFEEEMYARDNIERPLKSLFSDGHWGDREHNLTRSLKDFPEAAVAIGLSFTDNLFGEGDPRNCKQRAIRGIAATGDKDIKELTAEYRALVDKMIIRLKEIERPVYLRIGYEFDGVWNCYRPDPFKKTFRYIKSRIDALEANNIATVWQTAALLVDDFGGDVDYSFSKPGHLDKWYPGDDVVDWIGLSTFHGGNFLQHQFKGFVRSRIKYTPPRVLQNALLDFAREHEKPVMIAEAAPQAYSTSLLVSSASFYRSDRPITAERLWDAWYADWFSFIEDNTDIVRAVAYINTQWDATPMWRCDLGAQKKPGDYVPVDPKAPNNPACPARGYWGDSRVEANPYILKKFKAELQKPLYVNGGQ